MMKKICVFLSAVRGKPAYADAIRQFAVEAGKRNLGIIYGGSSDGLMGVLADTALAEGGHVEGVLPKCLLAKEKPHAGIKKLYLVETMDERKKLMMKLADAFAVLPGGLGTLEELFEIWNAAKNNLHQKPCGLLNIDGYYDDLIKFITHAEKENFLKSGHKNWLNVFTSAPELLECLQQKLI